MRKVDYVSCFIYLESNDSIAMLPNLFQYYGLFLGLSIVTNSSSKSCMFGRILS